MQRTQQRIEYFQKKGVKFLDEMPQGWVVLESATTAPNGYVWVCNNKSRFGKEYEHSLLKVYDYE